MLEALSKTIPALFSAEAHPKAVIKVSARSVVGTIVFKLMIYSVKQKQFLTMPSKTEEHQAGNPPMVDVCLKYIKDNKMKRMIASLALCALISGPAVAQANNIGSCGWGSKLFTGQRGIAPQVLGATTNGTSGNQTFAITSGTSGCTQDGVVTSSWKTAAFIDGNMNKLALDMSRGQGESLSSLAALIGVQADDSAAFSASLQQNFDGIFSSSQVTSVEVAQNLKNVLANDAALAKYSANV